MINELHHSAVRRRGKWGRASAEEVQEAMDAGIPHCYRFRSPKVLAGPGTEGARGDGSQHPRPATVSRQ